MSLVVVPEVYSAGLGLVEAKIGGSAVSVVSCGEDVALCKVLNGLSYEDGKPDRLDFMSLLISDWCVCLLIRVVRRL